VSLNTTSITPSIPRRPWCRCGPRATMFAHIYAGAPHVPSTSMLRTETGWLFCGLVRSLMQDRARGFRGTSLPRIPVNKGKRKCQEARDSPPCNALATPH
jgi:hypothetical protein